MENLKQAVEQIKNFGGRVRGFLEAADYLDKIADIEIYEREAIARKDQAVKDEASAKEILAGVQGEIETAQGRVKQAQESAVIVESNARENADKIIQEAQGKADSIISEAKNKVSEIQEIIKSENQVLENVKNNISAANNELSEIQNKIKAAKDQIASFVR